MEWQTLIIIFLIMLFIPTFLYHCSRYLTMGVLEGIRYHLNMIAKKQRQEESNHGKENESKNQ